MAWRVAARSASRWARPAPGGRLVDGTERASDDGQLVGPDPGDEVDEHGAVGQPEAAVVEPADDGAGRRHRRRRRAAPAGPAARRAPGSAIVGVPRRRDLRAGRDRAGGRAATATSGPPSRATRAPAGGVGAVPPQQPDEHVGRQPPAAPLDDGQQPLVLEHRPRRRRSGRHRAAAAGGSIGRSSARGRCQRGRRRQRHAGRPGGRRCTRPTAVSMPLGRASVATASATRSASGPAAGAGGSRRSVPSSAAVTSSSQ